MPNAFGTLQRYNDPLLYNSLLKKYKTPFGAVATHQTVEILFPVKSDINANRVELIIRGNDYLRRFSLGFSQKEGEYDNFKGSFSLENAGTYFYRFEIFSGDHILFAGKDYNSQALIRDWLPEWQLSVYNNGYKTFDDIKGGVVYHIFVDRFCKVGEMPNPRYGTKKKWHEEVAIADGDGIYRANDFYGGNFKGIESKLDYLFNLGVNCIYLSPIFESSSNHRYDTGDYSKIDNLLGTEKDFKDLIDAANNKGISIIIDGVFNHTGADSIYFNKFGHYDNLGAYKGKQSPYYDWYTFINFPDEYVCWWGITVVPTISRKAKGYQELIAGENGIINKWQNMGIGGWRLDVVDELSNEFVQKIHNCVKKNNPEALIIGEVWEDASTKFSYGEEREYFRGKQLDGVMNYVFKDAILDYVLNDNVESFIVKVMAICENYPKQSLDASWTVIDSHDTFRAINALAEVDHKHLSKEERLRYRLYEYQYNLGKIRLKVASALQYFLPGMPSLYYGDEIGMQGFEDPINRRPFTWDKIDKELLSHYKFLGKLRKKYRENFMGGMEITCYNGLVKIDREGLILIANAGEKRALNKPYFDMVLDKEVTVLEQYQILITIEQDKYL